MPQFRTNASLFESVISLVPAKLWKFLEARMLYDKSIENNCGLIPKFTLVLIIVVSK